MEDHRARVNLTRSFQHLIDAIRQCTLATTGFTSQTKHLAATQFECSVLHGVHRIIRIVDNVEVIDRKQDIRILSRHRVHPFFPLLFLVGLRSRGLMTSSMEKLMKDNPAPMIAIISPGGRNHHHAPVFRAEPFCA